MKKDYHEKTYSSLSRYYRPGVLDQEKLMKGLRENFTSEELQLLLMLPGFEGLITPEKLEKKAKKKGFSDEAIQKILAKLLKEGMIGTFNKPGVGNVYKRCDIMSIAISQIRTGQPGTFKEACTEFIVDGIEHGAGIGKGLGLLDVHTAAFWVNANRGGGNLHRATLLAFAALAAASTLGLVDT